MRRTIGHIWSALIIGLVLVAQAYAQPRGPQPDLPEGNGDLAGVTGVSPERGLLTCQIWTIKLPKSMGGDGVRVAPYWWCDDAARRQAMLAGQAPTPLVDGWLLEPEVRGATHATLLVADGTLLAAYSTPNDETSQVQFQERHYRDLKVPMLPAMLYRAQAPLLVTP